MDTPERGGPTEQLFRVLGCLYGASAVTSSLLHEYIRTSQIEFWSDFVLSAGTSDPEIQSHP